MGVLQPFEVLPEHSLRTRNRLRAIHGKRGAGVRHRSISDGVVLHPSGRRDEHGRLLALPGAGRRTRVWREFANFRTGPGEMDPHSLNIRSDHVRLATDISTPL